MAEFDPSAVPSFPIYTLHLDEVEQRLELDGMPLEPSYGQDPHAAGIDAVVRKAQSQDLEAVRVRVYSTTGDIWDMVVTAAGDTFDTTTPADDQSSKPFRGRKLLVPAVLVAVTVTIAGGITAAFLVNDREEPEPWATPGVDAQLPIALPSEYSTRAAWSVQVDTDSDIAALDDGHIFTTGVNGTLIAREPDTAQPVWRSRTVPDTLDTLVQTQWQSEDILAAHVGRDLYVWETHLPPGQDHAQSHAIAVDHGWRVDLNGPAPMIDMGDWIVGIPGDDYSVDQIVIPAGTRPLTATPQGGVLAVDDENVLELDAEGDITDTTAYSSDDDIDTTPDQLWMLDDNHALFAWDNAEPTLSIYRLSDGQELATSAAQYMPRQDAVPIIDRASQSAALGDIALKWGNDVAGIHELDGLEVTTVHDGVVYGTDNEFGPVSIDLTTEDAEQESWDSYNPDDPAPDLVTDDGAYVIAPQLDQTILYQAPNTTRSEDNS